MTNNKTAYIIIADGEFDQICETWRAARQEARDLRTMGCIVRVVKVPWDAQDDHIGALTRGHY